MLALVKNRPFAHDSPLPSVAPTLTGAYNRAYLASAIVSAQIPRSARNFRYTQPLYAIPP